MPKWSLNGRKFPPLFLLWFHPSISHLFAYTIYANTFVKNLLHNTIFLWRVHLQHINGIARVLL